MLAWLVRASPAELGFKFSSITVDGVDVSIEATLGTGGHSVIYQGKYLDSEV